MTVATYNNNQIEKRQARVDYGYGAVLGRMVRLIPIKLNDWLDGKKSEIEQPSGTFSAVVGLLVAALSVASISNMLTIASHHSGLGAIAGPVIAACVPVAVFVAAHKHQILTQSERIFAWAVAIGIALLSAMIQFRAYAPAGSEYTMQTLFSGTLSLEALAYSVGIPVLECVMAALASMVRHVEMREYSSKVATREAEKIAVAKAQAATEKAEQDRQTQIQLAAIEAEARAEERKAQMALETQRLQMQMRLEETARLKQIETEAQAQLIQANAAAEAKLAKITAKQLAPQLAPGSATSQSPQRKQPKKTDQSQFVSQLESQSANEPNDEELLAKMTALYAVDPKMADAKVAIELGVSKKAAQHLLAKLVDAGTVTVERVGRGKVVTIAKVNP